MPAIRNLVGRRFGQLVVLELDPNYDRSRGKKWICKCDCGEIKSYYSGMLHCGDAKSCGADIHRQHDLLGQKFARWTVIAKSRVNGGTNMYWECLYECGKIKHIRGNALTSGKSKSCRCYSIEQSKIRESLPKGVSAFNSVKSRYKKEAKNRGYIWEISDEDFLTLTGNNCHYCGTPPINKTASLNGHFTYNGIDRVDNNIGYTADNCVSCCRDCNLAKYKKSKEEFLAYIKRVGDYQFALLDKMKDE